MRETSRSRAGSASALSTLASRSAASALSAPPALAANLGCGNPLAVADLHPGERVLDLGSGGGIVLSARRAGPSGFAYGVDMTDEMLELAQANAAKAGPAMSSSSRAPSRTSRCRTMPWTW